MRGIDNNNLKLNCTFRLILVNWTLKNLLRHRPESAEIPEQGDDPISVMTGVNSPGGDLVIAVTYGVSRELSGCGVMKARGDIWASGYHKR